MVCTAHPAHPNENHSRLKVFCFHAIAALYVGSTTVFRLIALVRNMPDGIRTSPKMQNPVQQN